MYMALVDTGASSSCISPRVVTDLGLQPFGKIPVSGVHGAVPTNVYQFVVGFVIPQRRHPTGQIVG
jgi:predicted aspartyl protease